MTITSVRYSSPFTVTTITGNIGYSYKASGTSGSVIVNQYTTQIGSGSSKVYNFTYDSANANITKVTNASGTILNQYTYDTLGRLTREDNYEADRTYVYTYDTDGNILSKKTYGFGMNMMLGATVFTELTFPDTLTFSMLTPSAIEVTITIPKPVSIIAVADIMTL